MELIVVEFSSADADNASVLLPEKNECLTRSHQRLSVSLNSFGNTTFRRASPGFSRGSILADSMLIIHRSQSMFSIRIPDNSTLRAPVYHERRTITSFRSCVSRRFPGTESNNFSTVFGRRAITSSLSRALSIARRDYVLSLVLSCPADTIVVFETNPITGVPSAVD